MIEAMIQSAQEVILPFLLAVVIICYTFLVVWYLIISPTVYIGDHCNGFLAFLYFVFIIGVFIWVGNTIRILVQSGLVVLV